MGQWLGLLKFRPIYSIIEFQSYVLESLLSPFCTPKFWEEFSNINVDTPLEKSANSWQNANKKIEHDN